MFLKIIKRTIEEKDRWATRRTQPEEREKRRGLQAVGKDSVRREVSYALVCEKEEDGIVRATKLAERRRRKKVRKWR